MGPHLHWTPFIVAGELDVINIRMLLWRPLFTPVDIMYREWVTRPARRRRIGQ
jgi:hypothetical protein